MKQTARRILSLVLSFVMLVSMMTVFTFAANNYVPDDEYYDNINKTSYIVIPEHEKYSVGDMVTYEFRGKTYTEEFDPEIVDLYIESANGSLKLVENGKVTNNI